MYFYVRYGKDFLCNNLTILFQPHEAQALLYYRPIHTIRIMNLRNMQRMVVDVMMHRDVSNRYLKLHKKIISMDNAPLSEIQREFLTDMDLIEPIMNETVQRYEFFENNGTVGRNDILVGYNNHFTHFRHARFRRYDYEINYQRATSIPLSEGVYDYPDYIPPSLFTAPDNGRYGRARSITMDEIFPNYGLENVAVNLLTAFDREASVPTIDGNNNEPEPEWLEARPPRNVTLRRPNHMTRFVNVETPTTEDVYQNMFEQWSAYTRIFEDTYKYAQPEVQVEMIPQPLTATTECPICMTDVESKETVSLGCCVYSFCGNCYSNQYLTKENRAHQCMMCRTPFSKVQVYQESMVDKLKQKPIYPIISQRTPSQLTEMDDDEDFDDLPDLIPQDVDVITEFPPNDFPMTLSELN
jgi:hypothetical protein